MKTKFLLILFLLSCFFPKLQQVKDTILGADRFTILKTNEGYLPPLEYPWMKKTKVWFLKRFDSFVDPVWARGNTLEEINNNLKYAGKIYKIGTEENKNPEGGVCLDCGLGYFALVQLMDDFIYNTLKRNTKPNVGYGFACGKSSPKEAFIEAWKVARMGLAKYTSNPPKTFYSFYGINTETPHNIFPPGDFNNDTGYPLIAAFKTTSTSISSISDIGSEGSWLLKNFKPPLDNAESYVEWIENYDEYYKPYYINWWITNISRDANEASKEFDNYNAWGKNYFKKVWDLSTERDVRGYYKSVDAPIFTQPLKGKKINVKTSTKNNSQNNNTIKLKEQIISTPVVENKKNEKPENGNYEYIIHDIRRLEEYKNGKVRLIKDFNKNDGQLLKELFIDENGDRQEEKYYHENGKIKIHAIYKEGKLKTIYRYYQNGHLEKEEKYN